MFAVALALRLAHQAGLQRAWHGTHLFSLALGDAATHWQEAQRILGGDFWLTGTVPWKGPGYSYFLAALIALFGDSPGTLRWPLAALGAVNCGALVLLARRALPLSGAVLCGLLAAVNGVLILYDGELFFPTLLVALALPALALLARPTLGVRGHASAGALLGLSTLVHPVYLAPTATLALWIGRRGARHALAFIFGAAAVIAPVTLENYVVRRQPLLISWNGGINVYVGNQPAFDQYSGNRTNAWGRILQSPVDAGIPGEAARDRLYYRLALKQALADPASAARILLQKAAILFSPVEYASNIAPYEVAAHSPVLRAALGRLGPLWLPCGIAGPLMVLGWWAWGRRRPPLVDALDAWSLGVALSIVASFNTARYRAPIVFFGGLWAARAAIWARDAWREGRRGSVAAAGAALAALAALLAATAVPQRFPPLPLEWEEAAALASEHNFERAAPWVARALERAPHDPTMHHAAASFHARQGHHELAREHARGLLALPDLEPDLIVIGHQILARAAAAEGRFDEARREMEAAIAVGVDDTTWLGVPYYRLGLGPVTTCWLQLEAAGFELDAGDPARARALMDRSRALCPPAGRLARRLEELETRWIVSEPRL